LWLVKGWTTLPTLLAAFLDADSIVDYISMPDTALRSDQLAETAKRISAHTLCKEDGRLRLPTKQNSSQGNDCYMK
jgi:hypothetical protein